MKSYIPAKAAQKKKMPLELRDVEHLGVLILPLDKINFTLYIYSENLIRRTHGQTDQEKPDPKFAGSHQGNSLEADRRIRGSNTLVASNCTRPEDHRAGHL
jgi:hypothetical protein